MTILTALLAATAMLTAGATAPSAPDAAPPTSKSKVARYAVTYDREHDRYCVRDREAAPTTGTRLMPDQCKTSREWAADGLTIGRKN